VAVLLVVIIVHVTNGIMCLIASVVPDGILKYYTKSEALQALRSKFVEGC